jgi:hypothetical protein
LEANESLDGRCVAMTTQAEVEELCRVALDEESGWRSGGVEERKAAFLRFQALLQTIADVTGRTYDEVLNDAVEEWIRVHFCQVADGVPSDEWTAAGELSLSTSPH